MVAQLSLVIWSFTSVVLFVAQLVTTSKDSTKCVPQLDTHSYCVCVLDNGQIYDLRTMVKDTEIPFFKSVTKEGSTDVTYYYDPCRAFSRDDVTCVNVAICRVENETTSSTYKNLGTFENMEFNYDNTQGELLTLTYPTAVSKNNTEVILECNENFKDPEFRPGPKYEDQYTFIISSAFMCDQPTYPVSEGISFGTFLCITVPIVFFCYFAGGFLYLFFVKHETWENAVPHHTFWFSLPGLIKDGALFVWNSITGMFRSSSNGYDQI